ncbi:hypothetical protein, conserved [Entamoeba dispar SAW760]|uniref:Importin subunit alpha n=1 Tax=Entamoeba dispar (strain ATCC PRA-260 / SAW760) TaxID=370354 RepID=B0ECD4_ENTDS|nr:uncharacterized protein EDI_159100 [Entamoeba dispar SAW760]EDR27816.1 hypothetical protein, conserved [Entamoeba dispar SAW760]|eukprot:EDR27816.1 hypothetical protein, conserved [Entamoeba dispar SAW760]
MSFRKIGDTEEGLRSKRNERIDDRRKKREQLMEQRRKEESVSTSQQQKAAKEKIQQERNEFLREKYKELEEQTHQQITVLSSTPDENRLYNLMVIIASESLKNKELHIVFSSRIIPELISGIFLYLNKPLLDTVIVNQERLFSVYGQLLNIISDIDIETLKSFEKYGLIESTFKLLYRRDEVISVILDLITKLCTSRYFSELYLEKGILQRLVEILATTENQLCMCQHTAAIFATLSKQYCFSHNYIIQYIPLFSKLFSIDDESVLIECVSAATSLYNDSVFIDELKPVKIEQKILEILDKTQNESLIDICFQCLGKYCYFKDDVLLQPQIISAVVSKLSMTDKTILRRGYWMLSNISVSKFPETTKAIINSGAFLSTCCTILETNDVKIKSEACWLLANTIFKINDSMYNLIKSDIVYAAITACLPFQDTNFCSILLQGVTKFIVYDNTLPEPQVADGLISHHFDEGLIPLMSSSITNISKLAITLNHLLEHNYQQDL